MKPNDLLCIIGMICLVAGMVCLVGLNAPLEVIGFFVVATLIMAGKMGSDALARKGWFK